MNEIKLVGTYMAKEGCVKCKRLSENYDNIPVIFRDGETLKDKERCTFTGNIVNDNGKVHVLVSEIKELGSGLVFDTTQCKLQGIIKKIYPVRTTKKDRQLQDMLLEAGGQIVKIVAFEPFPDFIKVGIEVHIDGRLQERVFTQIKTFGTEEKTVFEVALKHLEVIKDGQGNKD